MTTNMEAVLTLWIFYKMPKLPSIVILRALCAALLLVLCTPPKLSATIKTTMEPQIQVGEQTDYEESAGNYDICEAELTLLFRINRWRERWIEETDVHHHAGPAISLVNLQDMHMSPLVYSGIGPALMLSIDLERERWYWLPRLTGRYAELKGSLVLPAPYQNYSAEAETALLYRIGDNGFSLGPNLRAAINLREYSKLQNNSFNSDLSVSLNAALRWERAFSIRSRSMKAFIRADFPTLAWLFSSPSFALQDSSEPWVSPKQYLRTTWESALTWSLRRSDENTARISYLWDLYRIDLFEGLYPQNVATHTIAITLGTRLM